MAWDNIISRTVWLFLQPSNLIFILLLIGLVLLWRGRQKPGLWAITVSVTLYGLAMFGPLTNLVMAPLESRFARFTNDVSQPPYSGIIILGGSERIRVSTFHHQVSLSGAAERLIEAAKLARQFPALPIIYSGGGRLDGMMTEYEIARKFFQEAGIDLSRIRFGDKSYNTYTNAIESRKLIKPGEEDKWFLVTSAFHMPRAVGAYRKAGIMIQPYPVDYRTELSSSLISKPDAGAALYELDFAVHEWLGLIAYYISGHSDNLFPTPQETILKDS
ncbi:MAG: YdcF family protein [Alphaproteobacteria bacterium]|nr:YdcF family protein [Alphaproteobacteria bacterium]